MLEDDLNEIDVPLHQHSELSEVKIIPSNEVNEIEEKVKLADKMEKHVYKKHALHVMVACGTVYLSLVIFDTVVMNAFSWKSSSLMQGFVELLKFVISTLIGFVFSENIKKKDD